MTKLPEDIFNDALDLPPEERPAFIASRCDGDETIRRDVEELLQVAGRHPEILAFSSSVSVPTNIGIYEILEHYG